MADRPIVFSAPMVRALLDGRKTQTRRVIKPQPCRSPAEIAPIGHETATGRALFVARDGDRKALSVFPVGSHSITAEWKAPYGIGDRLWVREAWATVNTSGGPGWAYRADGHFIQPEYDGEDFGVGPSFNYDKYPGKYSMWFDDLLAGVPGHQWKSPIHMPRWASRITLHVTDVRVQRLQDISEEDARAEGCTHTGFINIAADEIESAREQFAHLWNTLHGAGAWDANPWVAAITFTVTTTNIDALREPA